MQSSATCKRKRNNMKTENFPSDPEQLQLQSLCPSSSSRTLDLNMTADYPLPNSGLTAQNPFHSLTQLEVQLWTVPLSWMTEPYAQFLCCSLLKPLVFLISLATTLVLLSITFWRGSQPVQSFRKIYKKKNQYQIVLVLLQFNSSLTFSLFDVRQANISIGLMIPIHRF